MTSKYVDFVCAMFSRKSDFLDKNKVLEQDPEDGRINEVATTDNGDLVLSVIR